MTPQTVSFDVDGTLVNTRELNRLAYESVGVSIPDDAWGKPWHEWLPRVTGLRSHDACALHSTKIKRYEAALIDVNPAELELPPGRLARELSHGDHGQYNVVLLSAGSRTTVNAITRIIDVHPLETHARLPLVDRLGVLTALGSGVYVDDLAHTTAAVREYVDGVRTITYVEQTYEDLLLQVLT